MDTVSTNHALAGLLGRIKKPSKRHRVIEWKSTGCGRQWLVTTSARSRDGRGLRSSRLIPGLSGCTVLLL
jgi:hypothetical protein